MEIHNVLNGRLTIFLYIFIILILGIYTSCRRVTRFETAYVKSQVQYTFNVVERASYLNVYYL